MRKWIGLGVAVFGLGMPVFEAGAEMHAFELKDGRTLEAEIIDYDGRSGKVTLKRPDGKRVPVPADIFVGADQSYIQEWNAAKAFTSDQYLKITFDEEILERRKEEVYRDMTDTEGNMESYLMKEIKYEDVAFQIQLRNMNKSTLDGMRMEYRIYYEQSSENWNKQEPEQFVFAAEAEVSAVAGGQGIKIMTQPVTIYDDNLNAISWSDGSERVPGRGEVHGIRARLYMKNKSGGEIMREACYPKNLSNEEFAWKGGTGRPPKPVDSKQ
ncbi:hypothetical protein [Pontiella sp.]|uniref:hypothetical protein n=1 Tax=Pontiella sp. TaxID=2837462 RepID=UPI003567F6AD